MSSSSSVIPPKDDLPAPWNLNPFSQNLRSDIVLLSSWLHGSQPGPGNFIQPPPRTSDSLNFLTLVSNVLTTGNSRHYNAENVPALTGHIDKDRVHCLVFTENSQPAENRQQKADNAALKDRTLGVTKGGPRGPGTANQLYLQAGKAAEEMNDAAEKPLMAVEPSFVKKSVKPDVDRGRELLHSWNDGNKK